MNTDIALHSAFDAFERRNYSRAEEICRRILKKNPRHVDALHLLGMIHFERSDFDRAITFIQKALDNDPHFAAALNNLGNVYQAVKQPCEAISCFQKAIEFNPNLAQAYMNLGIILQDEGKIDEAIETYRKVIELVPDHYGAYNNLGLALQQQGNTEESIVCYQKAVEINPLFADAYNNLANAYKNAGRRDDAKSCYEKAIVLNPHYAEAYNNLGLLLKEEGYLDDAIDYAQKAILIEPNYVAAYNNLGMAYHAKGHLSEAKSYYRKAIEIDSHFADAYNNLGNLLKDAGNLQEAEHYFRQALRIQPDYSVVFSNCLLTMHYDERRSPESIIAEHIAYAEQLEKPVRADHASFPNEPDPDRKLRIGYVSPDFKRHSVSFFIEPVLSAHNHVNIEVFCYADVVAQDDTTKRLQGFADHWVNILGKTDDEAATLIRDDRIDILVDLAGHTGNNRMLLFARKPAPIQVTWIGYPATTGLSAMDYKIVDSYTDPPGVTEQFYTERLIRMPQSFLCYLPSADCPQITDLPAPSAGKMCFGSFNNFSKVSPVTAKLWASILQAVPNATLLLKAKCFSDEQTRRYAKDMLSHEGIDSGRIELIPWEISSRSHLSLYQRVDIALDTYPYHGTTTTCEALWMGVPVITLAGSTHASRVGVSLLSNVGLPELIAKTPEEYVSKAVALAHDLEKLKSLRTSLRDMLLHSPLTDAKRVTHHLEKAYRNMWTTWCTQQLHQSIEK